METMKGVKYGGFVYKKIDKYRTHDEEKNQTLGVIDYNSFIFTFKDDNPMKFVPKEQYKEPNPEPHFLLYKEVDWRMFVFGNCDIYVAKKGRKSVCENNKASLYDFQGIENALSGYTGWDEDKERFNLKRVLVLQFK